jgi:hypothetical protein
MKLAQEESWGDSYLNSTNDKNYKWIRQYVPTLVKDTTTKTDEYGRSYTVWADKTGKGQTVYAEDLGETVASYENQKVTAKNLSDDLDMTSATNIVVYEDGVKDSTNTTVGAKLSSASAYLGGRGSVVEVYDITAEGAATPTYQIVVINTYTAKVGEIKKTDKTVKLTYAADGSYIEVPVEGLAKGDVVSFNLGKNAKGNAEAYNVTVLESANIKVTATGTAQPEGAAYVRIDGTQTFASENILYDEKSDASAIGEIVAGSVYYDTYGNILYVGEAEVNNKTVDGYAIVKASNSTMSTSLLDGSVAAKLKIVDLATGTESVVDQAIVNDQGTWKYADKNGKASTATGAAVGTNNNLVFTNDAASASTAVVADTIYGYYVLDDGSYVLETVALSGATLLTYSANEVIADKGVATFKTEANYADSTTTLTVLTEDKGAYTASTVTGIANFTKLVAPNNNAKALVVADSTKHQIKAVYVLGSSNGATTAKTYGLFKGYGDYNVETKVQEYNFLIGDDIVTYTAKQAGGTADNSSFAQNVVYEISVDEKGDLKTTDVAATAVGTTASPKVVTKVTDSYIVVDGTAVYFNDNIQTVDLSKDETGLKDGASVIYYTETSGTPSKTTVVFITVVDPAAQG